MRRFLLSVTLLTSLTTAHAEVDLLEYQVGSVSVEEITSEPDPVIPDPIEMAGRVITVAKDVVALGEDIYTLLEKSRPKITTSYEPISIVPRDPMTKEIVDPYELEGFSMPVEKTYRSRVKNMLGKEVAVFDYKLMYSYGGSYNGAGKYLTGILIIPGAIHAKRGWTIDSTMKLTGLMNHGTRENPVVGAFITVKYAIHSLGNAFERNDTFHITGNGEMRSFIQ